MEVRSETGLISSREPLPFTVNHQKTTATNPVVHTQQPQLQNMRLSFAPDGTAIYKQVPTSTSPSPPAPPSYQNTTGGGGGDGGVQQPISGGHGGLNMNMSMNMNMNMGEPVKRKRGRPRKYGPDGTMALALLPVSSHSAPPSTHLQSPSSGGGGFSSPTGGVTSPSGSALTGIKKRGRPPGSGKKQQLASLGSIGTKFTPHIITVKAGEDISSMVMSFLQHGPRAVCVLSANGAISNVTLRQASMSGGTVTYEGRFEILSLSGSFLLSESGGQRSRTGGLSVSLAGPDGRVLGGGVAGPLTAASPVQVVVGSFIAKVKKEPKKLSPLESISATKLPSVVNPGGTGSPNSRGTLSESSGGPGSPLNQSTGGCSNGSQQAMPSMPWK